MQLIELEQGNDHILNTFIISSKPTQRNPFTGDYWQLSKPDIDRNIRRAGNVGGKHFMIDAIKLSEGRDAHYYGLRTLPDLLQGYANNSYGVFKPEIIGPIPYNDGTDDFYYKGRIQLRDSYAASALLEHGANTLKPFSISPHVYPLSFTPDGKIKDFELVGAALVIKGAFGDEAVISEYCKGDAGACEKNFSASVQCFHDNPNCRCEKCQNTNAILTRIINNSSDISKAASIPLMTVDPTKLDPNVNNSNLVNPTLQTQVTQDTTSNEVKKEDNEIRMTKQDLEKFEYYKQEAQKKAELEKQVSELVNKDKLNTLNRMFGSVKDDNARKVLIEKYLPNQSIDKFEELLTDVKESLLPLWITEAKESWIKESAAKTETETPIGKGKDKAASIATLAPEPDKTKVDEPQDKAASGMKSINQVAAFRNRFMGGSK